MRIRVVAAALLLAPLAASAGARAQTCTPHLLGGDRRGPASAISRSGTTLYLGTGAALVVVDTTDVTAPVELGRADLAELVLDVAHWQTTALALGGHGLAFVDAADPLHPALVGTFPFPEGWLVRRVTAREDRAYIPEANGLHVLDFTNPAAPVEIGGFAATGVRDVVLNGDRAYLLAGTELLVLDISNPASPVQIASVPVSEDANGYLSIAGNGGRLAVFGNWSYFHHSGSAAELYSLADPSLPALRSSFWYDEWYIDDVEFAESRAYVSELVYDVSNLSNPVYLGVLWPLLWGYDIARTPDPDYLFVADPRYGLQVADVSDPANPAIAASVATPGYASDGYLAGSTAVVVYDQALGTFDLSDPSRPVVLGRLDAPDRYLGEVARFRDHAFVTSGDGLLNFDLSDPAHPSETLPVTDYVYNRPVLAGDWLFTIDQCGEHVSIFDVSDPGSPQRLGAVHVSDECYKMDFTAGPGRLYVWDYNGSDEPGLLHTFDVSDPAAPAELGATEMDPWHWARSVARDGLLLLTDEDRFDVVDVRDPNAAVRVATLPLPLADWFQRGLSLYGSLALLPPREHFREYYDDRLILLDVADPLAPVERARIATPGDARGAFAGPGLIVVADGPAGISVYESCTPFADGFESGDASAWSAAEP
ncbi:MAG: hypothetical protein F9K16_14520 [Thermoanaerobaculia bacterium]|nr:MAG: hypothetical protein F9K16_14520 [Thermoanaerobaculia bacterium]